MRTGFNKKILTIGILFFIDIYDLKIARIMIKTIKTTKTTKTAKTAKTPNYLNNKELKLTKFELFDLFYDIFSSLEENAKIIIRQCDFIQIDLIRKKTDTYYFQNLIKLNQDIFKNEEIKINIEFPKFSYISIEELKYLMNEREEKRKLKKLFYFNELEPELELESKYNLSENRSSLIGQFQIGKKWILVRNFEFINTNSILFEVSAKNLQYINKINSENRDLIIPITLFLPIALQNRQSILKKVLMGTVNKIYSRKQSEIFVEFNFL